MKPITVSQSKVRAWRNCRQAYWYKHVEEIQPVRTRRPFAFGKIIHRLIEAQSQEDDPMAILEEIAADVDNAKIFAAEKEMYGEIVEDIRTIMTDYFQFYPKDSLRMVSVLDAETGDYRFAEHEFAIPLEELAGQQAHGIVFKGQVDGLARTPNKLRWIVENKSFDKMPGDDERWRNVQSVVYMFAVLKLKWLKEVDGICWNYVCSKAPTIPQLLKDGSRLSVREIVTLPSVVRRALKAAKLSPDTEDHAKLLRDAENSRHHYFQRIFTPVNKTVADNIWSGFVDTCQEIRDNHGKKRDKNIGRHCGWCDFESLCRAELTGGDVDFIKKREFEHEDPEAYRRSGRGKRSSKLKVVG